MKLLEWLAIWFGPQPQPKADPLRETLEEGRRRKFAEDYPGALAAFESVRAQLQPDDVLLATAVELFIGEVQIEAGDFASAEAQIERVAATANYPAQLIYLAQARGLLAQARGDLDAARTHYEEARAQAKEAQLITAEMSTAGHLAEVVLLDGNAAYAVHLLRENLPRLQTFNDPDLRCAFIGVYGLALIETGQAAEGLDMLRNALTLSEAAGYVKYERRWLLALAEQAIKDGRYYDAGAHLERALRLFDNSPRSDAAFVREYSDALLLAARTALYARDVPTAIAHAERAGQLADQAGDAAARSRARGLLGMALRIAGRGAEAIPPLLEAAQSSPSVEVLRNLAAAYDQTGDHAAAVRTYEQAIAQAQAARSPLDEAQARRDYGIALQAAGRLPEAIEQWTAALPLFEDRKAFSQVARLRTDLGTARRALGQHARALREYEQALMLLSSLDEHDRETRGLVLANAAVAYAEQGDAESADNFFSEAIAIAERSGDRIAEITRLNNYAWFLTMIGKPRRAAVSLHRAVELCSDLKLQPHMAVLYDNLGLAEADSYSGALIWHHRALSIIDAERYPQWAAVFRVNLAHAQIAAGYLDQAEALLDEALAYARNAPSAVETLIHALIGQALIAIKRGTPEAAGPPLDEAIARARQADLRRALAEALAARSQQQAALGDSAAAAATWDEAARLYARLSMPQAKRNPAWLKAG
ncbi:MAG: hypothetical protein ACUVS2_14630 [Candidatus Flexifilum sp.]